MLDDPKEFKGVKVSELKFLKGTIVRRTPLPSAM